MIKLNIKAKTTKATKYITGLQNKMPRSQTKSLLHTALRQKEIITKRTDKGQGVEGKFKKYTPEYAEFKKSIGQGSTPNLQVSNFMLSNIAVKSKGNKATVFFRNNKANELAFYNDKTRPFFSVNNKEEKILQKNFEEQLFKHLKI